MYDYSYIEKSEIGVRHNCSMLSSFFAWFLGFKEHDMGHFERWSDVDAEASTIQALATMIQNAWWWPEFAPRPTDALSDLQCRTVWKSQGFSMFCRQVWGWAWERQRSDWSSEFSNFWWVWWVAKWVHSLQVGKWNFWEIRGPRSLPSVTSGPALAKGSPSGVANAILQ